jgi:hypothetical protein
MRYLRVLLLKWDGSTEWRVIPWGKLALDCIRREGDIIYSEVIFWAVM